jgi:predicted tellurium resistance membrane protein TerC
MRIVLTLAAAEMLDLPYLKTLEERLYCGLAFACYFLVKAKAQMPLQIALSFAAIRTILVADIVMSLDNVIAVAAAAEGDLTPLVHRPADQRSVDCVGSTPRSEADGSIPHFDAAGGALLGYVAGEMVMRDCVGALAPARERTWSIALPAVGALLVVGIGKWLGRRPRRSRTTKG